MKEAAAGQWAKWTGGASGSGPDQSWSHTIIAPYRICPLGAHIDHQGGPVLGRTIAACTVLAFTPVNRPEVRLTSTNYPGLVTFSFGDVGPPQPGDWGNYARGAAYVLSQRHHLRHGFEGIVRGSLPGSGLSSSASVGLAYLAALATANDLDLAPWDLVEFGRQIENHYLSVGSGILDQATIVHGTVSALVYVDTRRRKAELLPDPPQAGEWRFLVAYTGFSRELTATGFSDQVLACRRAAGLLGQAVGYPQARILSDIPPAAYETHKERLPDHLRRLTAHFFGEVARVKAGRGAWEVGDATGFGALMKESYHSSIHLYGSGSEPIKHLQAIVSNAPGVYGSRFSGGGYGGCVVALVDASAASEAMEWIMSRYRARYPQVSETAHCFIAGAEGGLRLS